MFLKGCGMEKFFDNLGAGFFNGLVEVFFSGFVFCSLYNVTIYYIQQ